MSKLVPVQQTDRLGRTQRRWISAESGKPTSGITIPPPAPSRSGSKREAATAELRRVLSGGPSGVLEEALSDALSRVSAKTTPAYKVRAVTEGVAEGTVEQIERAFPSAHFMLRSLIMRSLTEGTPAHLNNLAVCAEGLRNVGRLFVNSVHEVISGLQAWGVAGEPPKDWSGPDEAARGGPAALAQMTYRLSMREYVRHGDLPLGSSGIWLKDRALHDLILRRPHDASRIVDLLSERELPAKTDEDIAYIESLIDGGGAEVLSNGAL